MNKFYKSLFQEPYLDRIQIFLIIIISLMPILLVTGPFLSDLALSISSLIFLIYAIKNKIKKFFLNYFFFIFIIFWLYILIRSLLSDYILLSLESSLFYFRFTIFASLVFYLLYSFETFRKLSFFVIFITFSFLILDGFIEFFFQHNIVGLKRLDVNRLTGFFREEQVLGIYLVRLLPYLVFLYLINNFKKKYDYLIYIIISLTGIIVFLSGERSAFFLFILFLVTTALISKRFGKNISFFLILFLISITFISINSKQVRDRMVLQTINDSFLNKDSGALFFSKVHESHMGSALLMFKSNVFFGKGVKTFRKFCSYPDYNIDKYSCTTHPHNTYVQLLGETGIFGFMVIFIIYIFISIKILNLFLQRVFRKVVNSDYNEKLLFILISLLISLWPIITNLNFFNNWINIIYFMPVGGYLLMESKNEK